MSVFSTEQRSASPYSLVSPLSSPPRSLLSSPAMAFESAMSSPAYTTYDNTKPLPPSSPEGNRSPLLSSADSQTFINPSTGAIALPFDDKKGGSNPFSDPPKEEVDNASMTVNGHSHHFATAHLTGATTTSASTQPAPAYDPTIEEVHIAAERLAQALEEAASRQTNNRAKRTLLKRARKVRQKVGSVDSNLGSSEFCSDEEVKGKNMFKMVGGGFLLLFTTPVYLSGAVIEGTGLMLKASGMVLKGTGKGLKKLHTFTVDKLDLHI
ncbi:hypothetical protein NMY22_g3334 [Coprinellus aureogranulatus]|nr:hypothetical protein NMY22_g3334 [Coprinellus aureogranulatus]